MELLLNQTVTTIAFDDASEYKYVMGTGGSTTDLPSNAPPDVATGFGRAIEHLLTSQLGQLTAFLVAIAAAIVAFQKLAELLKGYPAWIRVGLAASILLLLVFPALSTIVDQRRKRRLREISGSLQPGYFRLAPRDDEVSFSRADGKHQEILRWLEHPPDPVLHLTGLSGSGKSSLLAAFVLPNLARRNTLIIRLRGYQDPLTALEEKLHGPGVVWHRAPTEVGEARALLERACRYIRPRQLLVIFDQFEEFVILRGDHQHHELERLLSSLRQQPIDGATFLLVFRSDYIGLIEKLGLPPLVQDQNWKEVPPFTESAARDFVRGSGLQVDQQVLADVLHEATEIEQTKGLIRPVTINLCGLVLGRFAAGLPRGFRPGELVRGFVRESVFLPGIGDVAPRLIPRLITNYVTKRPRTIRELARDSGIDPATVRGCLRALGQTDRGIVRPLDPGQQTWEISHDFLVPLLDSITTRWTASLWRRTRPLLPWIAAICLVGAGVGASKWRRDPIAELTDLGWQVQKSDKGLQLSLDGFRPTPESIEALKRLDGPLSVRVYRLDPICEWSALKNLTSLDLSAPNLMRESDSTRSYLNGMEVFDEGPMPALPSDVSDVSPLKDLKNLTMLNLGNTQVTDVSPLRDLKSLTMLNLVGTQVSDVSPLRALKNLTILNLGNTHVSDVSPLRDLNNLAWLNLANTQVSDVSPLENLKNLTRLNLLGTGVRDVSSLNNLTNLMMLYDKGPDRSDVSRRRNRTRSPTMLYRKSAPR